jgi:NitT/TauT family transport system substrate-binding protein
MAGKPKPTFYIAILAVIVALIGLALWRSSSRKKDEKSAPAIDLGDIKNKAGGGGAAEPGAVEAPDTAGPTTVKEYSFVASQKLPAVKGTADYKPLAGKTVKFAINVWAGWAPIVFANEGFKPKKLWKTPDGATFKVELVLIDNPVNMRDVFASGDVHIGWATVDMLPLLLEGLHKDSRTMPRVFQQIDWSNGGDGIVVREAIKTMSDLRGKKVVLAQNSPSHFFLLNALLNAGVQPSEVEMVFTEDAFQAAAAFNAQKNIAGCVSWAPDIYKLAEVKGNKMLVSTQTANKLIADVWFARADFARDNPAIIEGLVRGIFDGMEALKVEDNKKKVAAWMSSGYSIPEPDAFGMLADAHSTTYPENREFFLNQNNPTNFERTFNTAYFLYKAINAVSTKVDFDQVMDFSIIQKLGKEPRYAEQKSAYDTNFAPAAASTVQAESPEILTKTVVLHFFPNSHDLYKKVDKGMYDPQADYVVEEVGKLAGQYGAARIVIEGHTDGSMKGTVDPSAVKELSQNRANAVKEALVKKFPTLQPNQFSASGVGWERPADPGDPLNHAKNRRVEIKVYPAEAPTQ